MVPRSVPWPATKLLAQSKKVRTATGMASCETFFMGKAPEVIGSLYHKKETTRKQKRKKT
jgi:hypothetical protein